MTSKPFYILLRNCQYAEREHVAASGRQIRHIDTALYLMVSFSEHRQDRLASTNSPSPGSILPLAIQYEICSGETTGPEHLEQ